MSKRTYKPWTRREEAELARLRAEGHAMPVIAAAMGRTYRSVKSRVEVLGPAAPKTTRADKYYEALQVIHTLAGVAARLGVKRRTVECAKRILRRRGYSVGPAVRKERHDARKA